MPVFALLRSRPLSAGARPCAPLKRRRGARAVEPAQAARGAQTGRRAGRGQARHRGSANTARREGTKPEGRSPTSERHGRPQPDGPHNGRDGGSRDRAQQEHNPLTRTDPRTGKTSQNFSFCDASASSNENFATTDFSLPLRRVFPGAPNPTNTPGTAPPSRTTGTKAPTIEGGEPGDPPAAQTEGAQTDRPAQGG